MLTAIIIDDEMHAVDTLSILLAKYCPDVQVVDKCMSAEKALKSIVKLNPDIVFLDIEMPVMNGFELLEQFKEIHFAIIFTTSYDQYAIKAMRLSAMDYLLKPVVPKELVAAVQKVALRKTLPFQEQFEMLANRIKGRETGFQKIAVPTSSGFELIPADQILYCEVDDNYTHITTKSKGKILACRSLKDMEEQFRDFDFFARVHNSYLVNLNEVEKYNKGEGGYVVMSDGHLIDVSRSRKEMFLNKLQRNRP
ncbi:MAG: response regulator transcription factor [Bacteroidetes bacterium]|nr:response regulator transcription factor [Bacteroidota bacterium]